MLTWPWLLYQRDPVLFDDWLVKENPRRFFGTVQLGPESNHTYYLKNIAWIAWPAFRLAPGRSGPRAGYLGGFNRPGIQLPVLFLVISFAVLTLAADARMVYALPMLLPLCLLASASVDVLPRGASSALDWFGILTFGLAAIVAWIAWASFYAHWPPQLYEYLIRFRPAATNLRFQWFAFAAALFFTLVWFAIIRPARQSPTFGAQLGSQDGAGLGLYSTICQSRTAAAIAE
jgi:hypothetical protein